MSRKEFLDDSSDFFSVGLYLTWSVPLSKLEERFEFNKAAIWALRILEVSSGVIALTAAVIYMLRFTDNIYALTSLTLLLVGVYTFFWHIIFYVIALKAGLIRQKTQAS